MKQTQNDKKYMRLALKLAAKGRRRVFLNPLVGCVIVKNGKIISKGYHEYFGGKHAEINAIESAKEPLSGATLYVNLEPCSHWGKTPPCTDAIIASGISRVVVGMTDPNHRVNGYGIKTLQKARIATTINILRQDSVRLNTGYINSIRNRKPKVIVKFAMTLDGKIASRTGDSKWISSKRSRALVHSLRTAMDGILVGINTVLKDNPELTSHGKGRNPARILLDPKLQIPLNSNILDRKAPTIIFCAENANTEKQKKLKKMGIIIDRVPTKNGKFDFKNIINKLLKMSIYKVLIEGGGNTIAAALKSRVVDEIYVFIAPKVVGGKDALSPVEGSGFSKITRSIPLQNMRSKMIGNDLLITAHITNKYHV